MKKSFFLVMGMLINILKRLTKERYQYRICHLSLLLEIFHIAPGLPKFRGIYRIYILKLGDYLLYKNIWMLQPFPHI